MGKKERTSIYIDREIKRKAIKLGLNISRVAENALKSTIRAVSGAFKNQNYMAGGAGFEPATPSLGGSLTYPINYPKVRADFIAWLGSRELDESYRQRMIRELDRHVTTISGPMDLVRIFTPLTRGQKHNLNRAVSALLNFLEKQGFDSQILDLLRANIPKDQEGIDVKIPTEADIIQSLRMMSEAAPVYNSLYNLVLDSGLRLTEAVRFSNSFASADVEGVKGFYVAPLGYFRTSKVVYYAFFTEPTMQQLKTQEPQTLTAVNARGYRKRRLRAVTSWKYLRKFAFDKMIELEVPESVADFIQGRTPKKIGAKHYMALLRQAKKFYPRYAEYITRLRARAK